uniref:Uncharacterized protein LOC116955862 n=1 Tax=Petromyzon marinus TaxID=7757 RepID=A0AAJ7XG43_PETMA|nr:uncharacterized protein LOC116955862 [Petromyzon marinus]
MFMMQKLRRCWRTLMPAMLAILVFMTHMFFKNYVSRDIKLIQAKEWTPHTLALPSSQQAFEAAVQMNATAATTTTNTTSGMPEHRGWDITHNTCEPKAKYLKRWWFKSFDPLFKGDGRRCAPGVIVGPRGCGAVGSWGHGIVGSQDRGVVGCGVAGSWCFHLRERSSQQASQHHSTPPKKMTSQNYFSLISALISIWLSLV